MKNHHTILVLYYGIGQFSRNIEMFKVKIARHYKVYKKRETMDK